MNMLLSSWGERFYVNGRLGRKGCERRKATRYLALLALSAFWVGQTPAQGLTGLLPGQKTPRTAAVPADPLKRASPRSAIYALLEACHNGNLTLASQYLDLRKIP